MKSKEWIGKIQVGCLIGLMLFATACGGSRESGDLHSGEDTAGTVVAQSVEVNQEVQTDAETLEDRIREASKFEAVWYAFETPGFAFKLPEDLEVVTSDPSDINLVLSGRSDSMDVTVRRWNQVSNPEISELAALVAKDAGVETQVVKQGSLEMVKVNWTDGLENYYFLAPDGDAYYLQITPHVMKDPYVYWKISDIVGSLTTVQEIPAGKNAVKVDAPLQKELNYLLLVNKKNPLPEHWEEELDLVCEVNSVGDTVWVERSVYKAYIGLREEVKNMDGIEIELDSAYRSVAYQQDILERFTEKYGAEYAAKTVATPGYSEHHTGLAIDLYFRLNGEDVYYNEDMVQYPEIWEKIHARLAAHGFILRYPELKAKNTGYSYEPWHIRYVGVEAAEEIMADPEMTFEEWLEGKK